MAVTRLKRKGRRNKVVAKQKVADIQRLNSKPVIKTVDVEAIKEGFKTAAKKPAAKKAEKEEVKAEVAETPVVEEKAAKKPAAKKATKKTEESEEK